ncbi:MAG: DUF4124 domain-containing protein [Gammaproteobacteria bacterium]
MKSALLLLLAIAITIPAMATTVYRWVDKNGVVHYSDQPHPGAVKVDLGTPQVVNFKKTPPSGEPAMSSSRENAPARHEYHVTILAPANGTTLRPANHEITAQVSVSPLLGGRATLQYALDGEPLGKPTAATRVLIKQVYRGTHTLTATVLAPDGASAGTASSTFYVHQHSVLFNHHHRPGPHPNSGGG